MNGSPNPFSPQMEALLQACFAMLAGEVDHGLPEQVARYIKGETATLPDDLGWVPPKHRLLGVMREIASRQLAPANPRKQALRPAASEAARPPLPVRLERATAAASTGTEPELRIRIWPGDFVTFTGTRAQLEAEGFIPEALEWPQGRAVTHWEANGYRYTLNLCKRGTLEGPMKAWAGGDYWRLCRVTAAGAPDARGAFEIKQKRRELAAAIWRHSPEGKAEAVARVSRYAQAQRDDAFQAFKALLLPERRTPGRPRKAQPEANAQT